MNLHQIIGELRAELEKVDEVLAVLDGLARTQEKRKGRPTLAMLGKLTDGRSPKRRPFSPETRKKMAAAQKKRWANIRKQNRSEKDSQ